MKETILDTHGSKLIFVRNCILGLIKGDFYVTRAGWQSAAHRVDFSTKSHYIFKKR